MTHYILQFDGGSRGNPGPSAAGAVIFLRGEKIWQSSKYLGDKYTNNYAEYQATIAKNKRKNKNNSIRRRLALRGQRQVFFEFFYNQQTLSFHANAANLRRGLYFCAKERE